MNEEKNVKKERRERKMNEKKKMCVKIGERTQRKIEET